MKRFKLSRRLLSLLLTSIMLLTSMNIGSANNNNSQSNQNENGYIVTFKNDNAKEKFAKDKNKSKKIKQNYEQQASVAVELTAADIAELSASADVLYIEPE